VDSGIVIGFIGLDYRSQKLQSLETVSSSALVIHLDLLLLQVLPVTGISLNFPGANWTNSSSWSNQTARLARLLNSNPNCLPLNVALILELLLIVSLS
jgi:hypothetical protein